VAPQGFFFAHPAIVRGILGAARPLPEFERQNIEVLLVPMGSFNQLCGQGRGNCRHDVPPLGGYAARAGFGPSISGV
jgi:hypothetical protein